MEGILILLAYLFGKYQDDIINYLKVRKNIKSNDFYDGKLKDKDFKEGGKDDKEANKKNFIWD